MGQLAESVAAKYLFAPLYLEKLNLVFGRKGSYVKPLFNSCSCISPSNRVPPSGTYVLYSWSGTGITEFVTSTVKWTSPVSNRSRGNIRKIKVARELGMFFFLLWMFLKLTWCCWDVGKQQQINREWSQSLHFHLLGTYFELKKHQKQSHCHILIQSIFEVSFQSFLGL